VVRCHARQLSLRVLSNLAANAGMRMRRYDFVAAYLQGELLEGETVYCFAPPGIERNGNRPYRSRFRQKKWMFLVEKRANV
jgi:hypothetical protein